jgi:hypothetical protein
VVAAIPATPYPDERYQTQLMWWDRSNFANYGEPEQVAKVLRETQHVIQCLRRADDTDAHLQARR